MAHKIAFIGAGSFGFTRSLVRDLLSFPAFHDATISLMDINAERLAAIKRAVERIVAEGKYAAKVEATMDRKEALVGAEGVVTTILAGDVDVWQHDILIPKKYGVDTNVGDTRGPSGIFRYLRTINPIMEIAADIDRYCPNAVYLNYTNPMAMLCRTVQGAYPHIVTSGLCHSVQGTASMLAKWIGAKNEDVTYTCAGINHQAWLLEVTKNGVDLYPEIKRRALARTEKHHDMVRYEIMKRFGYYVTESSEHNSEYMPYFIKSTHPELIDQFNIPLDEYPRRCINQIAEWEKMRENLLGDENLTHTRSREYASYIMEAMETNRPFKFGGNVINTGLITNLPSNACVEVPCIADASGVQSVFIGDLPEQCAAMNRTNINPQLLAIEAAVTKKKDYIYQAAMLDPHTAAELTIDQIVSMCDDLIEAHKGWLPEYH